jgi:hypothetical protein
LEKPLLLRPMKTASASFGVEKAVAPEPVVLNPPDDDIRPTSWCIRPSWCGEKVNSTVTG